MSPEFVKSLIEETVQGQQIQQQLNHNIQSKDRQFQINDTLSLLRILVMSLSGYIAGTLMNMVKLPNRVLIHHVDHI